MDRSGVGQGFKYGTINCGRHPLFQIWDKCECVYVVGRSEPNESRTRGVTIYPRAERLPFSRMPPVDCLFINGSIPIAGYDITSHWLYRLVIENKFISRLIIYVDGGEVIFSEGYRQTVKALR